MSTARDTATLTPIELYYLNNDRHIIVISTSIRPPPPRISRAGGPPPPGDSRAGGPPPRYKENDDVGYHAPSDTARLLVSRLAYHHLVWSRIIKKL